MKLLKSPFLYLAALLIVSIYSFTNKTSVAPPPQHPNVGDVVYSILVPKLFKANHTGKWELLDGRPLDQGTSLYQQLESNAVLNILKVNVKNDRLLPDARGVFIRSVNEKRDPATGDPDGDKEVGRYQADQVGPHSHGWTGASGNGYPDNETRRWSPEQMKDPRWVKYVLDSKNNYSESGMGAESRPRNISLYAYIKVGD